MEELKQCQIFMLYAILEEHFHGGQWQIISAQPPSLFLLRQQIMLNKLLKQQVLFDKYFQNFYDNHVKLLNWSVLAVEKKAEITPYVFKNLVNRGRSFFNRKVKYRLTKPKKEEPEKSEVNAKLVKDLQEQVYKQFFDEMVGKNKVSQEKNTQINLKTKHLENLDGHQFYIRTFNACNGWKYIFYNYEKHMKGKKEVRKYNQKIRPMQQRSFLQSSIRDNLGLLDFEQPQLSPCPSRAYKINTIVGNSPRNSVKVFKKMLESSSKNKLCFTNHQGKPITYRACRG